MELETKKKNDILIVRPLGKRVDAKVAVEFKTQIEDLVEQGYKTIVLDVADIDFIDSSGLGAIVAAFKYLGRDGEMVISGARKPIMSMFKLTRMDRVFKMFDTQQDAVIALSA